MKKQTESPAKSAEPLTLPPSPKKVPLKKIISIVALVGIVLLAGLIAYRHDQNEKATELAYRADKVRFAGADRDIRTVYDAMKQSLGKPDVDNYGRTCAHTSQKYSEGTLYCTIYFTIAYGVENQDDFSSKSLAAADVVAANSFTVPESSLEQYKLNLTNKIRLATLNTAEKQAISCDLRVEYADPDNKEDLKNVKASHAGSFNFKCSGLVTKPIYPLAE